MTRTTILTHADFQVPSKWAMFSERGNKRIAKEATRLVEALAEIHDTDFGVNYYVEGKGPRSAEKRAFRDFFRAYRGVAEKKSYREAGDTAVREQVWSFAVRCSQFTGHVDEQELDAVWCEADPVCS